MLASNRTFTWFVRNKRINAAGRAVFDLYRTDHRGFDHHQATVEVNGYHPDGIKCLFGAMTMATKDRAWEAIRAFEKPWNTVA